MDLHVSVKARDRVRVRFSDRAEVVFVSFIAVDHKLDFIYIAVDCNHA